MKVLFKQSRQSMGSRRMANEPRLEGFNVGRDWARRRMKAMGLVVKHKRKFKITTDRKHTLPIASNVLNRAFNPAEPNRVWGTDITYLWTLEGWVCVAVVIDLYSRRVVGWAMDKRMKKALVIRALIMAVNIRRPGPGLIHHSDRGSQYANAAYQKLLKQNQMIVTVLLKKIPETSRQKIFTDDSSVDFAVMYIREHDKDHPDDVLLVKSVKGDDILGILAGLHVKPNQLRSVRLSLLRSSQFEVRREYRSWHTKYDNLDEAYKDYRAGRIEKQFRYYRATESILLSANSFVTGYTLESWSDLSFVKLI